MLSDPAEYRRHAVRCNEQAKTARDPSLRKTLQELAATWIALAVEVERNQILMDDESVMEKSEAA
jgi:predicted nucleic acid-binding protein